MAAYCGKFAIIPTTSLLVPIAWFWKSSLTYACYATHTYNRHAALCTTQHTRLNMLLRRRESRSLLPPIGYRSALLIGCYWWRFLSLGGRSKFVTKLPEFLTISTVDPRDPVFACNLLFPSCHNGHDYSVHRNCTCFCRVISRTTLRNFFFSQFLIKSVSNSQNRRTGCFYGTIVLHALANSVKVGRRSVSPVSGVYASITYQPTIDCSRRIRTRDQ